MSLIASIQAQADVLLDDTILRLAIREAIANRGYEADPFPPGNLRERGTSSIEAARRVAGSHRGRPFTTAGLVDAAVVVAGSGISPSQQLALAEVHSRLRLELEPILRPDRVGMSDRLRAALAGYEPAVVVSTRSSMPYILGNEPPVLIDPGTWLTLASSLLWGRSPAT